MGSTWFFYVWLGFEERGSAGRKFSIRPVISTDPAMLPGVVHSSEEKRIPPLSKSCFHEALDDTIKEDACAIGMSDSALVHQQLQEKVKENPGWHGVHEVHLVNHSATPPERAISISVLADVESGERRAGMSGSQMIDGTWKYMDAAIPEKLNVRPDNVQGHQIWTEYVRFAQWQHMIGTGDKYQAFCRAAEHFEEANAAEKVKITCREPKSNPPAEAVEDKIQVISDAVVALESDKREASQREDFQQCVVLQKQITALQERSCRIQRNRTAHAAKRLGTGDDEDIEFLGEVVAEVPVYGEEWRQAADVDWAHRLGYSLLSVDEHALSQRGCVNEGLTHCFAVALLQALSSLPRVKVWCREHALCCQRQLADPICMLCALAADLADLEEASAESLQPRLVEHRALWAPEWQQAKQECAMEAFLHLLLSCDTVDHQAAEVLGTGLPEGEVPNDASEITFPALQIFGGLLKSTVECNYPSCRRKSCKYEILNHMQVNIPTGRLVTVQKGIEQAQEKERLLASSNDSCPACQKSLRTKLLEVQEWPATLVVQVKRWCRGSLGRRWAKHQGNIGFEESMELGGRQYSLRAVVVHKGGATRGHYYTYVNVGALWLCYNDTLVSDCSWADVLRDEAYVLFYDS